MRHLTTIVGHSKAEAFVAYLLTQDISTHVETTGKQSDEWDVWIRDEDRLPAALQELEKFQNSPNDPVYQQAIKDARTILKEKREQQIARQKQIHTPRYSQGMPGRSGKLPPLTLTLIIICVALGLASEFSTPQANNLLGKSIVRQLKFVDMQAYLQTGNPAYSLERWQLWRIFTPAFLHGDALHLLMNMLSLASLGRLVERMEGTARYAWMMLLIALVSHLLQGLTPLQYFGSPNFVGISGVVLGLFGYVAVKSNRRPDLGVQLSMQSYVMVGLILILGFSNGIGSLRMANLAHIGGLIAGLVLGFILSNHRFDRR